MGRRGPMGKVAADLLEAVRQIKQGNPNYGRTRVRRLLEEAGFKLSDSTATKALRRLGLQLPPKKRATEAS